MAVIWNRINTLLLLLVLLALLAVIGMLAAGVRGGPLDPLTSPQSTDSVKLPGTPISSAPYVISQPGHYYLTRNLSVSGAQDAITIDADDVSLDLGGFTVRGDDTVGTHGILVNNFQSNIAIANGTVRDFHVGVKAFGDPAYLDGIRAFSNIRGFELWIKSVLTNCGAAGNTETGIVAFGTANIRGCEVTQNAADGIAIHASAGLIEGSRVQTNSVEDIRIVAGFGTTVRDNVVGDIRLENSAHWAIDNVCVFGSIVDVPGFNYAPTGGTSPHDNADC